MGVTRPQAPLRQPYPVSLPQPASTAGPEEEAETRGAWGAGSTVLGRGEPGSALLGLRHGPQTEAKPWKQDHITRALVFDDRSLNKLENKCLTLSQSKHCPWSRSKPVHIRAGRSQAAWAGRAAGHPDNSEGSVHTRREEPQGRAGRKRVWLQGFGGAGGGGREHPILPWLPGVGSGQLAWGSCPRRWVSGVPAASSAPALVSAPPGLRLGGGGHKSWCQSQGAGDQSLPAQP